MQYVLLYRIWRGKAIENNKNITGTGNIYFLMTIIDGYANIEMEYIE